MLTFTGTGARKASGDNDDPGSLSLIDKISSVPTRGVLVRSMSAFVAGAALGGRLGDCCEVDAIAEGFALAAATARSGCILVPDDVVAIMGTAIKSRYHNSVFIYNRLVPRDRA